MKKRLIFIIALLLLLLYMPIISYGKETSASNRVAYEKSKLEFFDVMPCIEDAKDSGYCVNMSLPKNKILTIFGSDKKEPCEVRTGENFEIITTAGESFAGTKLININCHLEQGLWGVHGVTVKNYSALLMKRKKDPEEIKIIHKRLIQSKVYKESFNNELSRVSIYPGFSREKEFEAISKATAIDYLEVSEYPCSPQVLFLQFTGERWRPIFIFFNEKFHPLGSGWGEVEIAFKLNDKLFFSVWECTRETDSCGTTYYELKIQE